MAISEHKERGIDDNHPAATVNVDSDGDTLGACLFLGVSDLEALGIDDAEELRYAVEDGILRVIGVNCE